MRGAERFAKSDLAGAFGDRHEHDVDDADGAERQRNDTDHAEKPIHAVEELVDALVVLDGVPVFEGFGQLGIETVTAGNDVVDFLFRHQIPARRERTIVQKRNCIFAVLVFQPEQIAHGPYGNEDARIGAVVAVLSNFSDYADNFEADAVEQDGRTRGRASGKYVLQ